MGTPQAQTIAQELGNRVNSAIEHAVHYFDPSEFQFKAYLRDARKLMTVDATQAHSMLVLIHSLTGDVEQCRRHYRIALELGGGSDATTSAWCAFMNLGFMTEARELTDVVLDPTLSPERFMYFSPTALTCGSVISTCASIDKARALNMDLRSLPIETYERAKNLMSEFGLTDTQLASVLDVAGDVLRSHRLFYAGRNPRLSVADKSFYPDRGLYFTFDLFTTPDEASDLYFELADRLLERFESVPDGVHVSFRGIGSKEQ